MYWSLDTDADAVETVWMGDDDIAPDIGHRTDPVLGPDLVFTLIDGRCTARLQGPVTRRHTYPHVPGASYVGLRFRPGAGTATIGAGLRYLHNGAVDTDRFDGIELDRVGDELLGVDTLHERGLVVARHLTSVAAARSAPNALVVEALRRLAAGGGGVSHVAADLGVSERRLQRVFERHLGITPKHAGRLVRVQRLLERVDAGDATNLAGLAVATGFFDQAHMTNEVRRVLDTTPGRLLADAARRTPGARRGTEPSRRDDAGGSRRRGIRRVPLPPR